MSRIAPKGWCPTLFTPMASGDGFLLRVHAPGSFLTAATARALAQAAAQYGNGVIDIGNRGSLQIRGLRGETVMAFAAAMVAAGLAHPDPAADRRRNVIAPPLGDARAARVVREIEAMQMRESDIAALHGKFGVSVDAGALPVGAAIADIRVVLRDSAVIALDGSDRAAVCAASDVADTVLRLCRAFLALAARQEKPPYRMQALVAQVGADAVFAAAGLVASTAQAQPPEPVAIGPLADATAFGIGLPFGATDAATLASLADLAERFADGVLRLTPWRAIVLRGVTDAAVLSRAAETLGLMVTPDDARSRVAACPGAPACASASVPARADASLLASLGLPGSLHVSGCAKGCAHPGAADLTLVGDHGAYDLVRHGRAGDMPTRRGLTLADIRAGAFA